MTDSGWRGHWCRKQETLLRKTNGSMGRESKSYRYTIMSQQSLPQWFRVSIQHPILQLGYGFVSDRLCISSGDSVVQNLSTCLLWDSDQSQSLDDNRLCSAVDETNKTFLDQHGANCTISTQTPLCQHSVTVHITFMSHHIEPHSVRSYQASL